jgi:hypothetical protein
VSALLNVLKGIGRVATSPAAMQIASLFGPLPAAILGMLGRAVATAEISVPGEKRGAERLPVAKDVFLAHFSEWSALFEAKGYRVSVPDDKLAAALNANVQAMNAMSDLIESIKIDKA